MRWIACRGGRLILVAAGLASSLALLLASTGPDAPVAPLRPLIVDPNLAPQAVLEALPRLGPVLAGRIVSVRSEAPFRSPADLDRRVRGIGPATVAALRPHLQFPDDPTDTPDGPAPRAR